MGHLRNAVNTAAVIELLVFISTASRGWMFALRHDGIGSQRPRRSAQGSPIAFHPAPRNPWRFLTAAASHHGEEGVDLASSTITISYCST